MFLVGPNVGTALIDGHTIVLSCQDPVRLGPNVGTDLIDGHLRY